MNRTVCFSIVVCVGAPGIWVQSKAKFVMKLLRLEDVTCPCGYAHHIWEGFSFVIESRKKCCGDELITKQKFMKHICM